MQENPTFYCFSSTLTLYLTNSKNRSIPITDWQSPDVSPVSAMHELISIPVTTNTIIGVAKTKAVIIL